MEGLFRCRAFTSFGPNYLDPLHPDAPLYQVRARRPGELRQLVRDECPKRPGVYGWVDPAGRLIYVGKAKCLRSRLLSYFRPGSRDPKAGRILRHARRVVWEIAPGEFAALVRELHLIQHWQPRFNVQGQPYRRRRTYVCLGRRPAPYLFLARRPPAGAVAAFGPIHAGHTARDAVRRLNDAYLLRDCSQKQTMAFADQQELFPVERAAGCLRYEIGTCLGPCAAACTRGEYADRVEAARAFLEGRDPALLTRVEAAMKAASTALAFERAADLRDQGETLSWLSAQLARVREARAAHSVVYPVPGADGRETWYLLKEGRVVGAAAVPDQAARAAELIEATYLRPRVTPRPGAAEELDAVLLVSAWFRKYEAERARLLDPAAALQRCSSL